VTSQPVRLTDPSGAVLPAVLAAPWVAEGVVAIGALIGAALWSNSDQAADMSRIVTRSGRRLADDIIDGLTSTSDTDAFTTSSVYADLATQWGALGANAEESDTSAAHQSTANVQANESQPCSYPPDWCKQNNPCTKLPLPDDGPYMIPGQHFCQYGHMHYWTVHQSPPPECKCRRQRRHLCVDQNGNPIQHRESSDY